MIYLDNAATTGRKPEEVIEAVAEAMRSLSVNAGRGSYALARKASDLMDECRQRLLKLAKIRSGYHVFFAPSATIAMNQLILGMTCDLYSTIYVSPFEHNAVMRPIQAICDAKGCTFQQLPFDRQSWAFNATEAESLFLQKRPDYVFVSMVSNTTGFVLPLAQIISLAHNYGAKVIVDCAQAMGSLDVDFAALDADAYVFAGHKTLYGPYGVAGILLSEHWKDPSGISGGTGTDSLRLTMPPFHAGGFEPGSPNLPAIAGLNAALRWIEQITVQQIEQHERALIASLSNKLSSMGNIQLYLPPEDHCSNMVAFNVRDYESRDVGQILDEEFDIGVRTGYQCAPLVHDWLGSKSYGGLVRLSVSYFNTQDDINSAYKALVTL